MKKPTPISTVCKGSPEPTWLEKQVAALEECGGNLEQFCELPQDKEPIGNKEGRVFAIEQRFTLPENTALQQRWQTALRLFAKVRMDLLKCKALNILDDYQRSEKSSSADIQYARTLLIGELVEDSERVKKRYRPVPITGATTEAQGEENVYSDLEDKFDAAEGS